MTVLSQDDDLIVLENDSVALDDDVPLCDFPMCTLPPRSFRAEMGASQDSCLRLLVSGREDENSNGYMEVLGGVAHELPASPQSVKFRDDVIGRMDAELDELCRERASLEEEYYGVFLPQIMRPSEEVLESAASEEELRFTCNFFVSVQSRILRIIAHTLARSFDYCVDALIREARESISRAEESGDAKISLKTLLKSVDKLNPYQRRRRRAYLDAIKRIAVILHGAGRLVNPRSYRPDEIDLSRCLMNDTYAHVYLITQQKKSGTGTKTKCGVTSKGSIRIDHYDKEYQKEVAEAKRRDLAPRDPPAIISVVSIDNLPLPVETEISDVAREIFMEFGCLRRPRTAKQAVMFEIFNVSIGTGLLFRSLACSEDECSEGGAMNIRGNFKRTLLSIVESAVQGYLSEDRGMTISGQVFELVAGSNALAIGLLETTECAEAVGAQVDLETEETQVAMVQGAASTSLISTYSPAIIKGNENHKLVSPMLHRMCVEDNWTDTCVPVPCANPKNSADMYGHGKKNCGFTEEQLSYSCDRKDALLRTFTLEGGGAVIVDKAKQCMTARENREMAEYIQTEFTGSGGETYEERTSYLDCTVLAMNHSDGQLRRAYVVDCPGFVADTNPTRPHGDKTLTQMLRR